MSVFVAFIPFPPHPYPEETFLIFVLPSLTEDTTVTDTEITFKAYLVNQLKIFFLYHVKHSPTKMYKHCLKFLSICSSQETRKRSAPESVTAISDKQDSFHARQQNARSLL